MISDEYLNKLKYFSVEVSNATQHLEDTLKMNVRVSNEQSKTNWDALEESHIESNPNFARSFAKSIK